MTGILVNRRQLAELKSPLEDLCHDPPKGSLGEPYVVLLTEEDTKLPQDGDLQGLMDIASRVTNVHYVMFSNSRNIAVIVPGPRGNFKKDLKEITRLLKIYMPEDTIVWGSIENKKDAGPWVTNGFGSPYMTKKSPLDRDLNGTCIALVKKNKVVDGGDSEKTIRAKIDYAMKSGVTSCELNVKFGKGAIEYLKSLLDRDKEVAGLFVVKTVKMGGNGAVFELSHDEKSSQTGKDESVDAVWNRFNWHTHPKKAYENHGVTRGWPSSSDYNGFTSLKNHTIVHTVSTVEGLYTISYSDEWLRKTGGAMPDSDWIASEMDISHHRKISFTEYAKLASNKRSDGIRVYDVLFLPWSNPLKVFKVCYAPTRARCLATEESFNFHKRL
jgi:hypothetical protein